MLKKLGILLMMAVVFFAAPAAKAAVVDSGTCGAEGDGSNLVWTLDDMGTLTISGHGTMKDFKYIYNYFQNFF